MKYGDHYRYVCRKPITTLSMCANCTGKHLSISLRCPQNSNNTTNSRRKEKVDQPQELKNVWSNRRKKEKKVNTREKTDEKLNATLKGMLMDLTLLGAKDELKVKFVERTNKLIALYQKSKKKQ